MGGNGVVGVGEHLTNPCRGAVGRSYGRVRKDVPEEEAL